VNSTLACSLVAAKLVIPVAHVEAGLRSFDPTMPEEINRLVTDRLSDLLFTPSPDADRNLEREGVPRRRIHRVGNIMVDSLVEALPRARRSDVLERLGLARRGYAVVTLHRPSNVDPPRTLFSIMGALHELAGELPLVFSCHPRTAERLDRLAGYSEIAGRGDLRRLAPLGYLDFLRLVAESRLVLTDSGGLQEETTWLRIPCVTLRENTERPITVEQGTNRLAGADPVRILAAAREALAEREPRGCIPELWDGRTAERIADVLGVES
jgi:UDP-N-acetylglucosamine 2-epimerase (non-hydrolysing)